MATNDHRSNFEYPMEIRDREPTFDCPVCGHSEATAEVDFDALGYPVCPTCGHHTGPAGSRLAGPG